MKKNLKCFGIMALVVLIGLSLTACDDGNGNGGVLAAPSGLTATAVSSSDIQLTWNAVGGAAGYNVYASLNPSSGFQLLGTTNSTAANAPNGQPSTTYYFRVAAYAANGTEGLMSNTASATTHSSGDGHSLNGIWESGDGQQVTVSGSTGVFSAFGSPSPLVQDAITKSYYSLGGQRWRNITSTGNLTWSGQNLNVEYYTSNPNVAVSTVWRDCTFAMSADGQTMTLTVGSSSGITFTRSSYSLNGVWETSSGYQMTVSGNTGVTSSFGTLNAIGQDAANKGYISLGEQRWRNITSTGNLTWSGQWLNIEYYTSSPNVAVGTVWVNCTFTMSADGQTLTVTGTGTWTRKL